MKTAFLSESIAVALGCDARDQALTFEAIGAVRARQMPVDIRLGVGPLRDGRLPARALAHAECLADTIRGDLRVLIGPRSVPTITIFSSAPKARVFNPAAAIVATAALATSLRAVGVEELPIRLEMSAAEQEIPPTLNVSLDPALDNWFEQAATNANSLVPWRVYAMEHSAASMFGDLLAESGPPALRITIGATTEGRFWAVRQRVRQAAISAGIPVAPALGLIMKSCRVPWYNAAPEEPLFSDLATPTEALGRLEAAANPAKGGNAGLKKEARALRVALSRPSSVAKLLAVMDEVQRAPGHVRTLGFELGHTYSLIAGA